MTAAATPGTVKARNRSIYFTDAAIAVVILGACLQFFQPGWSNLLWMLGCLGAALGIYVVRASIGKADLPTTELDEYERQRHLEAREVGLTTAFVTTLALFVIAGAVAFASKFWFDLNATDVALFFSQLLSAQLLCVTFSIARSLAGKINRDELIEQ